MALSEAQRAFAQRLGHDFGQPDLLRQALTHPSHATPTRGDNQRLEFLGDRVLGLIVAEALMDRDVDASEGDLAPRFNALVRKETLADVGREIGLGDALRFGRSEMLAGGRRKNAALADAMEAVIAAVYRDGGLEAARALVLRHWGARIARAETVARDAKTALQEWAQARGAAPPVYEVMARDGPAHAPVFTIRAVLEGGDTETAQAGSKRQAEQAAAQALLARLERNGNE